nr:hypothetical protein CFP56_55033 [Quercus suber]
MGQRGRGRVDGRLGRFVLHMIRTRERLSRADHRCRGFIVSSVSANVRDMGGRAVSSHTHAPQDARPGFGDCRPRVEAG